LAVANKLLPSFQPLTITAMNCLSRLAFLLLLCTGVAAIATDAPKISPADVAAGLMSVKIDGMQDLPITGLKMVKTGEQIVFMSSNGRFALYGGKLLDVWTQQEIKDLPDIDRIARRIDLSRMKLNIDDLGPVIVGRGKDSVLIFIDPRCPYCGKVMKDLQALLDRYTFKLVMVPILGQESQNIVVQLACQQASKDQKVQDSVRQRLLKQDYAGLPTDNPASCNKEPLQRAIVTAKLFGLPGVPFLIASDGRTHSGAPESLADWLENKPAVVQAPANADKMEKKP
jgi:thiol:disulfide interchange protein DsbC